MDLLTCLAASPPMFRASILRNLLFIFGSSPCGSACPSVAMVSWAKQSLKRMHTARSACT